MQGGPALGQDSSHPHAGTPASQHSPATPRLRAGPCGSRDARLRARGARTLLRILTRWYRCSGNGFRGMKRPAPLLTWTEPSSKTILPWLMTTSGEPWHSMPSKTLYSTACGRQWPRLTAPRRAPAPPETAAFPSGLHSAPLGLAERLGAQPGTAGPSTRHFAGGGSTRSY